MVEKFIVPYIAVYLNEDTGKLVRFPIDENWKAINVPANHKFVKNVNGN